MYQIKSCNYYEGEDEMKTDIAPSEMLNEVMEKLDINQTELANDLGVSKATIANIINKKRKVSKELAFRFSIYFRKSPESFIRYQISKFFEDMSKRFHEKYKSEINTKRFKDMVKLGIVNVKECSK
jgi:addiction module HigA family antidote